MLGISGVLEYMTDNQRSSLEKIDFEVANKICEIRIRRNQPLILVIRNTSYFLDESGDVYNCPAHNIVYVDSDEFDKLFLRLCDYSLYSNSENLKNGFITLSNGARVGVSASAVYDNGKMISVKDITSLNIRIPRESVNCSSGVLNFLYTNAFPSIIVAGRANSGKTTLLRDISRGLSSGFNNRYVKVAIIDERNEFAAKHGTENNMNVGINTDVLTSFSKSTGIDIATRVLSPELIVCDEISTDAEVESIIQSFSSGIKFALSVHCADYKDLINKSIIKKLLFTKEFSYIILLDNYTYKPEIIDATEVYGEIFGTYGNCFVNNRFGHLNF